MTMQAGTKWISCEERNPEEYGKYRVLCVKRGQRTEDDYLWNGSYWVTPGGSPSKGVEAWAEKNAPAVRTETRGLTLADYEARIHLYKEQIGTGYIGIGRTLNEAKAAGVVPHGQWETWVTETTGLTPRQAQRCMQAATEIRDGSAMARLEMSKALMLLGSGLDEDQREAIAEKAAEEGATVKALKEEIRQTKLKLVQETGATAEIRQKLERAEAEKQILRDQLKDTIDAYQNRMDQAEEEAYRRGMKDTEKEARDEIRKEFQQKIDYINGERNSLEWTIKDLKDSLAKAEESGSVRWDEGFKAGQKEAIGLRNELNKQTQYAEELRGKLLEAENNRVEVETVPADYADLKRNQADLLAAAEDAEKRAAEAEAELEALRAGGAGQPDPVWKVLKLAVDRFMTDCEMLPLDPAALIADRTRIAANVNWIGNWVDMMRKALDTAVPAEGAVV